jgi:hypothetical protein
LLEKGHAAAGKYPLAVVWSESRIVRQRQAGELKLAMVSMQSVLGSLFSKEGNDAMRELIRKVDDGC